MKLLDLQIGCYGHFQNLPLDFSGDGLQLVYGSNEAGKTTLLEFVREILFGFAERNAYDFGVGRIEGTARMRMASGQLVELRRHKGRKNNLLLKIDGHDAVSEGAIFNNLLGGATPNLFRSVFAFGLQELSAADSSLNHESVRSALYGGGLANVVNPKHVLDVLVREAEQLFKERGQNQPVNALSRDLAQLTRQIKEQSLRPDQYLERRLELERAQAAANEVGEQWAQLRQEHSQTKKLVSGLPVWLELQRFQAERKELTVPTGFPLDGEQQFNTVLADLKRLTEQVTTLSQEIEDDEGLLQEIDADPRLLEQQATIEHAHRLILSVTEARRDLPLLQAATQTARRRVQNELTELTPGWSFEDLEAFRLNTATQALLTALIDERRQLREARTVLVTKQKTHQTNSQETAADLAALGDPLDVADLRAVLEERPNYEADVRELARLQSEERKTTRNMNSELLKLNPPLIDTDHAQTLPALPKETVVRFQRQFLDQQQSLDQAAASLKEEEANLALLKRDLANLYANTAQLPTRDGLQHIRGRRNLGWELIRRKFIVGHDPSDEIADWLGGSDGSLPDRYEEAVRDTDRYADSLFDHSSIVLKQEQVDAANRLVQAKEAVLESHRAATSTLHQQWADAWQPCGFVPLEPDAMAVWCDNHRTLAQLTQQRDQFADDTKVVAERVANYEERLRDALSLAEGEVATHHIRAGDRVAAAQQKETDRRRLQTTARRLQDQAELLERDLQQQQHNEQAWQSRWEALLARIRFPSDWEPDLVQNVISRLTTARVNLEKVSSDGVRIQAMEQRLSEFDPLMQELCTSVAPELLEKPPEIAATTLHERLTAVRTAQERKTNVENGLVGKRRKVRDQERLKGVAQDQYQALLKHAETDDDNQFRQIALRAKRISELDASIAIKERELALIRENEPEQEFWLRLQNADVDAAKEQLRTLAAALEQAGNQKTAADEQVGACRTELAKFDEGRGDSAELQSQAASKRAQLATQVDRYVPLVFAHRLLQDAIQRFERESQPEMLAEVSRIFRAMTAGRYVRVERPLDDESPLLVHRFDDELLEPHQLSTGTREQLYLCIRLAYVLHYCGRAEPLPIVMDDVLANFDEGRVRHTLEAVGDVATRVQVIMFTCHRHLLQLAQQVFPGLQPQEVTIPAASHSA